MSDPTFWLPSEVLSPADQAGSYTEPPDDSFRWATVTSLSPLRVRIDGDSVPIPVTPDVVMDSRRLRVGTRVWVQLHGRRLLVLGAAADPGRLPDPVIGTSVVVYTLSATDWGTLGAGYVTATITLEREAIVMVTHSAWLRTFFNGPDIRVRLNWSGANSGDSYSLASWAGVLYEGAGTASAADYANHSTHFPVKLAAGTTTFFQQGYKAGGAGGSNPNLSYSNITLTPIRWT